MAVDSMGITVDKSVVVVDTHRAQGIVEKLAGRQVQGQVQVRQEEQLVPKRWLKAHLQHATAGTP